MAWIETTLGEVLPLKYGKNLPAAKRSHSGEFDVVTSAGVVDSHCEPFVDGSSIVIGRKGTVGSLTYCADPCWPTDTAFYTTGSDLCDLRFGYYFLQTLPLSEMNTDSAVPGLNRGEAEALPVRIPNLETQRAISLILRSLDDKIAANVEGVCAIDRLRNALWDRNLSDGTTLAPLSSLASFVNGGAFTKNATGTGRVVVRIAEMNSGIGNNTVRNELDVPETKIVRTGELLFSWSGTLMTKRWPYDEAVVNQHIFKVIPDRGFPLAFLDCVIEQQLKFFRMIAAGKATTMGHIKRSDLDAHVQIPIQFREEDLCLAESLWVNASVLEKENITLARTRDELLPLLMNGKISVREAEQEASAAGVQVPSEGSEA
ncbi:restriction endonuclease subunit S [uncultured Corynebacterium sp.]|uniref:restriction endonuclease subunit S n=1 Tax=uncultured Corynebacterium sp. TaxID=159447 RepID=UPI002625ABA2|nr:restriction endonuclease subunit S [uncultured Corynebacterium sp.]